MSDSLKFGLFTPACFDTLFVQHNLLDVPCLKKTIVKLLGFAIIAGSVVLKVPQILKIVRAGNAKGLAASSYALTLFTCIVNIAYNVLLQHPFSSYGENVSIAVQDAILVLLIAFHQGAIGIAFAVCALAYAGSAVTLIGGYVAFEHIVLLKKLALPIFCASRVPQIWANFSSGHTGQLSLVTVLLQFGGAAARVATTLSETGDQWVLVEHGLAASLNGLIFLQILLYWSATEAANAAGKAKKTDDAGAVTAASSAPSTPTPTPAKATAAKKKSAKAE